MNFFEKLEAYNDTKHDLRLIGIYFVLMILSLGLSAALLLFEPGKVLGTEIENVLYILKIAAVGSAGLFALYCLIKIISTIIYMIRR